MPDTTQDPATRYPYEFPVEKENTMAVPFSSSATKENLMRAFAGESQARNRYTFAAGMAKKNGLYVVEQVFLFTANQEKEHAEIFYKFLKEFTGETIYIDGGYPVDLHDSVEGLLRAAQHNEYEEHDDVYKHYADVAKEDGFDGIAARFRQIAKIEKVHGDRFGRFADYLEQQKLFVSDVETGWICLNCGHIINGTSVPEKCPVCGHDKGYFIRLELAPYTC